jgi:hypothetical protein
MATIDTIEKQKTWDRLEKSIGKTLVPMENRKNWRKSVDEKLSFYLAYSKYYPEGSRYWYGIKEADFKLWEEFERSFVIFVLGQSEETIAVPAKELHSGLTNSYIEPTSGERYKVHILREGNKFHFLEIRNFDINPYYNYFNQITVSSASDYTDSEYSINEQQDEYKLPRRKIFGKGGESMEHKRFMNLIAQYPSTIGLDGTSYFVETEFILPSADTIDVLFSNKFERIGVEVKSKISNIDDITRGLFQCVKYAALLGALNLAEKKDLKIRTILVLENSFPTQLIELKNILGIEVLDNIK